MRFEAAHLAGADEGEVAAPGVEDSQRFDHQRDPLDRIVPVLACALQPPVQVRHRDVENLDKADDRRNGGLNSPEVTERALCSFR